VFKSAFTFSANNNSTQKKRIKIKKINEKKTEVKKRVREIGVVVDSRQQHLEEDGRK
jgi:hypothetical protein